MGRAPAALGVWKKIADSHVDSYFCFHMRFFEVLDGFGIDFGRFRKAKMDVKYSFFEKADFVKIVVFLKENYFSGIGP